MGKMLNWAKSTAKDLASASRRHDSENRAWLGDHSRHRSSPVLRIKDEDGISWTGTARQIAWARTIRQRLLPRIASICRQTGDWHYYEQWAREPLATSWIELQALLGPDSVPSVGAARAARQTARA